MSLAEDKIAQLVEPALNAKGVELVDLTYRREPVGWVLRVFIEKPGGINLGDCQTWSDEIGRLLDEHNLIATSYTLEVSSPGINRPLKKKRDFEKFAGEKIQVKLFAPLSGRRHFTGILRGMRANNILVEETTQTMAEIPFADIAQARLDRDIKV